MKKIIISTLVVAMATPAFADKEGDGTIIGAIIGGLAGNIVGGKKKKTETTIVGALLGAVIGNRVGNDMDRDDRAELERASNDAFNGNAGRSVDWNGRKHRGRVSTSREGYYRRNDGGRVRCRDYRSEIYRGNEREIIEGTVCEGRNGWERTERRDIDYGGGMSGGGSMGGPIGGGYNPPQNNGGYNGGNQGQSVELGFVNPVSRRTGGEYLALNVNGLNLRKITLRASGDRMKIYRVIATGINGNQLELVANQAADQFLYLGSSASFDSSGIGSQIVRIDILAEAFGANGLGISVTGEIGNSQNNGNIIPRDNGIGGGRGNDDRDNGHGPGRGMGRSEYTCVSRDNDGRSPYVMGIRNGISVNRINGETFQTSSDCENAIYSIKNVGGRSLLCVSSDNDGRNPYALAVLGAGGILSRIRGTTMANLQECQQTLDSINDGRRGAIFCVSRDNDGRSPYTAVQLDVFTQNLQRGSESFQTMRECQNFIGR